MRLHGQKSRERERLSKQITQPKAFTVHFKNEQSPKNPCVKFWREVGIWIGRSAHFPGPLHPCTLRPPSDGFELSYQAGRVHAEHEARLSATWPRASASVAGSAGFRKREHETGGRLSTKRTLLMYLLNPRFEHASPCSFLGGGKQS